MKNIFIIGSKGIPSNYGGFETFVEKLTEYRNRDDIKYHVSCLAKDNLEFQHNGARCFNVDVPNIGPAKAIYYDIKALDNVIEYIDKNEINDAIVYILACRIGPFLKRRKRKLDKLGAKLYINPDGHEWKRSKWNWLVRKYWQISEKYMVKNADLVVCDSMSIEKYISDRYQTYAPKTKFIAYGADVGGSRYSLQDKEVSEWFDAKQLKPNMYYLIVGRFVPENNYYTMIDEFIKSSTDKDLVIITNVDNDKFYSSLESKLLFENDKRVKFVGTVYDQDLLKIIRQNAYAYLHGHEVGGTNPSLLEALATTKINLLLDVGFNREVGENSALYWTKNPNNLSTLIDNVEILTDKEISNLDSKSLERIKQNYSWELIRDQYNSIF